MPLLLFAAWGWPVAPGIHRIALARYSTHRLSSARLPSMTSASKCRPRATRPSPRKTACRIAR